MSIVTINPATGEMVEEFAPFAAEQVDQRLALAAETARSYRATSFAQRAGWLRAAADLLEADRAELAALVTGEMGKTFASAQAEVNKCAAGCRFYAEHGASFMAEESADAAAVGAVRAYIRYEPLGVVLAVMPWNFPLWQVLRFAAPALMAGNVGVLKHASNVPRTALYLEELFRKAGFPAGAFQTLLIGGSRVADVVRDPRVAAVTLTGSEGAGRAVAAVAGGSLKKTVLELGGSDPFLVLPSADLPRAARVATTARCQNNGQSCIAAKRFIVHADVYDEFAGLFVRNMRELRVGDPMELDTEVGPLATEQGRRDVEELVDDAVASGATVLCGGARGQGRGWFYLPTVLADVTPSMRIFGEEVFGPVAVLHRAVSLDVAIELANATAFGLGSNAWTSDPDERRRCIEGLEAGAVFVNGMVTSHPELPFGGIKVSGYGRELSAHGMREFCNVKTVWEAD